MKSVRAIETEIKLLNRMSGDSREDVFGDLLYGIALASMCLGAIFALQWVKGGEPPSTMIQRESQNQRAARKSRTDV